MGPTEAETGVGVEGTGSDGPVVDDVRRRLALVLDLDDLVEARRLADHLVSIPMPGRAESLNAAAAAAICAYELMRKNQMRGDHPCKS